MTVTWHHVGRAFRHGVLLGYAVSYGRHEGNDNISWKKENVPDRQSLAVLEGLQKFAYYSVSVCGFTAEGCGQRSKMITVRMREDGKYYLFSPVSPP